MIHKSSISITSGDFDGDGDLDLIVGSYDGQSGKLYLFNNDGKGNFLQK